MVISVRVRVGGRRDIAAVLALIKELANFEKMLDKARIGAETLEEDGFGKRKYFRCLVAVEVSARTSDGVHHDNAIPSTTSSRGLSINGTTSWSSSNVFKHDNGDDVDVVRNDEPSNPSDASVMHPVGSSTSSCCSGEEVEGAVVGYALFFPVFSWRGRAVYMEDLYVTPRWRGKGLGTRIWRDLVKLALSEGCVECRFSVLDWNTPSIDYYRRKEAEDTTGSIGYNLFRLDKGAMLKFVSEYTSIPGVRVRTAAVTEASLVNALQQKLAEALGILKERSINASVIEAAMTGSSPLCHVLLAEVEEDSNTEVVGYAMYCYTYSTWEGRSVYLEDLYVRKEYGGRGIGTLLWQSVVQLGLSTSCSRCDFVTTRDNASVIAFYEKKGAVNMTQAEGWHTMLLRRPAMETLAGMKK